MGGWFLATRQILVAITKLPKLGALSHRRDSQSPGGCGSEITVRVGSLPGGKALLLARTPAHLLYPRVMERQLWLPFPLSPGHSSHHGDPTLMDSSNPHHPPKMPRQIPTTSPSGVRVPHMNSGGGYRDSVQSKLTPSQLEVWTWGGRR